MILSVDLDSAVPPYEQIRVQLTTTAASGVLPPRSRLPTIRQLAADLGLAAGTVGRAYRELEAAGVIVARGRNGTCIAEPPKLTTEDRVSRLRDAAASYVRQAGQLGASPEETIHLVHQAMAT